MVDEKHALSYSHFHKWLIFSLNNLVGGSDSCLPRVPGIMCAVANH